MSSCSAKRRDWGDEALDIRHADRLDGRSHGEALKLLRHRPQDEEQVLRPETRTANPSDEVLGHSHARARYGA